MSSSPIPPNESPLDTSPLLPRRPSPLRGAASFLRRASSRRLMREPSVRVREAAAEQIEERQSDWAYSKPIVVIDLVWNIVFVVGSVFVLVNSRDERPSMPLRLWIVGYGVQCVVHVVCVCVEYRRRRWGRGRERGGNEREGGWSSGNSSGSEGVEYGEFRAERGTTSEEEIRYVFY